MENRLRVASCQFPVSDDIENNAHYIQRYMKQAFKQGASLLHTSEACLSGYAGSDFSTFAGFDWGLLREQTGRLRRLARDLGMWLVLGSAHFLDNETKPTNCLYLVNPEGDISNRYDKCMCTKGDQKYYSAGQRLVTQVIQGQIIGLAICYDICYPQIYAAYRELGVKIMLHSFYNAHSQGKNCLDVLNVRQVPTRCADNVMWAVANNSSRPYSHWASFVARPDATIAQKLKINTAGLLVHDFPDTLSDGGWLHNFLPMQVAKDEKMFFGEPTMHPRQDNGQAEP
ncbi:MAG: carbon-nitrogen hydrolase family protein [Anaerolineae bacterium]|nr:carbon-nitrogen hydrolase family protein [Anaerolineae bacterium]